MQKGFSSVLILLISFIMIAVLALGVWYYFQFITLQNQSGHTELPSEIIPPTKAHNLNVPQGWKIYNSEEVTFAYPQEAEITKGINNIDILLKNTPEKNSTPSGSLTLNLSTSPLNEDNLMQAAENDRQYTAMQDGVTNTTMVSEIFFGEKNGYSYTSSGAAALDIMFFPLSDDLYLKVTKNNSQEISSEITDTAEKIISTVREN